MASAAHIKLLAAARLLVIVGCMACSRPVAAREAPFPAATDRVIIWSTRSCYAEATWSEPDCTALMHVIRKRSARARWPFVRMLKAYSVANWAKSQHGKSALGLRLGFNEHHSRGWNRRWRHLVRHVVDVLNYRAEDPCPNADHWAAKYYQPKSPMLPVTCDVETLNAFWVAKRR